MKKQLRTAICILLAATLWLAMSGCGASTAKDINSMAVGSSSSYQSDANESYNLAVTAPDAPMEKEFMEDVPEDGFSGDSVDLMSAALPDNVKMIYTANLELETTAFDATVSGFSTLVQELGGWLQDSSLYNYNNYREATYTFRVPAERFHDFCQRAGELCTLRNIQRNGEDVSERYYDSESRLATQRTKLARLQELLAQAEKMEDIITLESAISETELAIEQLTGTLRHYDSLVGYSTVYISLREVYKITSVEEPAIGFWAKLGAAFQSGTRYFVDDVQDLLLDFARGWAGWLIFLLIVTAVILLVRRKLRRRKAKKAQQTAPAEDSPAQK